MALPDLRLLRDDLFVINRRITANDVETYKVNAEDIGVFLLESPRPPGSSPEDKFINDGPLNVYGEIPGGTLDHINLHSANEYCEGKLNFREGFYVTGADMDVTIHHDYAEISKNLACLNGGIDGTTTCLKIDMQWLSEHIICSGSGLDTAGDCIFIDLCPHSGLVIDNTGCLEVSLCPDRGIIHDPLDGCLDVDLSYLSNALSCEGLQPQNGDPNAVCMEIDMVWLSANIRCGAPTDNSAENGSGLIDEQGCIRVDPCWVSDQWNTSNNNSPNDTNSIDVEQCEIAINEAWLLQWAKDNINDIKVKDCLTVSSNTNLFKGDVTIGIDETCLKIDWSQLQNVPELCYDADCGDDGTTPPPSGGLDCAEPPLFINSSGCIEFVPDPDTCTAFGTITTSRVTNTTSGNPKRPGMTLGIYHASAGDSNDDKKKDGNFIGFCGSAKDKRIRMIGLGGWTGADCDEPSVGEDSDDMAFWRRDSDIKNNSGEVPAPWDVEQRTMKNSCLPVTTLTGKMVEHRSWNTADRVSLSVTSRDNPAALVDGFTLPMEVGDPEAQGFDLENIADALVGTGTSRTIAGGLIAWERISQSFLDSIKYTVEDPYNPQPFAPSLRADRLAQIHPALAEWTFTNDSFERAPFDDDDPDNPLSWGRYVLKEDENERTKIPVRPNDHTLIVLLMVANRRQKARIAELEAKTTREGTLNTLGIVEYTNETAAANSGLGQGEVYWDTSLNRMRAVT